MTGVHVHRNFWGTLLPLTAFALGLPTQAHATQPTESPQAPDVRSEAAPEAETDPTTTTPAPTSEIPDAPAPKAEPESGGAAQEGATSEPPDADTDSNAPSADEADTAAPADMEAGADADPEAGLGDDIDADMDMDMDMDMDADMDMDIDLGGDFDALLAESVVAGASRTAESSSDAPATTSSVRGSDLRRYGMRNVEEAIQYLMGGLVVEPTGGQLGGRGLTFKDDQGAHVLLLLDGHFVNENGAGIAHFDDLAGIPIEMIDRIEVVFGPGSVLYGANAMLGVVNVVTKRAKDMEGLSVYGDVWFMPQQDRKGQLKVERRQDMGRRRRTGFAVGHEFTVGPKKKDGYLTFQAEWIDTHSQNIEVGPQYDDFFFHVVEYGPNTGSGNPNVWSGVRFHREYGPNAYSRLKLGPVTASVRSTYRTRDNAGSDFHDANSKVTRMNNFVDVAYDYDVNEIVSGRARAYADHYQFQTDLFFRSARSCFTGPGPCRQREAFESAGVGVESQWSFDWAKDGRWNTMLGVDGRLRWVAARLNEEHPEMGWKYGTSGIIDRQDWTAAGYLQQMARITPKFAINAGARFDQVSSNFSAFSPRGAIIAQPWKGGTLKAMYNQAFRAPTAQEQLLELPGRQQANPDLSPERVQSGELAVSQRFGAHNVTVAGFATLWRDMIARTSQVDERGAIVVQNRNVDDIQNFGGNVGYELQKNGFQFGVNGTYAWSRAVVADLPEGEDIDPAEYAALGYSELAVSKHGDRQPIELSPTWYGNTRVAYTLASGVSTFAASATVIGPRLLRGAYDNEFLARAIADEDYDTSDQAPPTGRVRLSVSGDIKRFTGLGYSLAVDYTFNTQGASLIGPFGIVQGIENNAPDDGPSNNITYEFNQTPRVSVMAGLRYAF